MASFSGTLEGLGDSITGLTIDAASHDNIGLIGTLRSDGVVRDLGLAGASVAGLDHVGALVGDNAAGATITDAIARGGAVSADGGVAVGGLVGLNLGTVTGASASDRVIQSAAGFGIGGLVGYSGAGAVISASSARGQVSATDGDRYVGGLVGYNDAAISDARAFGRVIGPASLYVGGLVGYNGAAGTIDSAYASGVVSAPGGFTAAVGGLVGYNAGTISNTSAYSRPVSAANDVGGLVGYNTGPVSTSWSSGPVSGTSSVGGSIGLQVCGALASLYWDEGTSGQTTGVGSGPSAGVTGIGGATGLSPFIQSTYGGFNFSTTWTIIPGASRPYLRSLAP